MCITAAVSVCALGLFILAAAHLTVSHGAVPVPLLPNNAGGRSYLDGALLGLLLHEALAACMPVLLLHDIAQGCTGTLDCVSYCRHLKERIWRLVFRA